MVRALGAYGHPRGVRDLLNRFHGPGLRGGQCALDGIGEEIGAGGNALDSAVNELGFSHLIEGAPAHLVLRQQHEGVGDKLRVAARNAHFAEQFFIDATSA